MPSILYRFFLLVLSLLLLSQLSAQADLAVAPLQRTSLAEQRLLKLKVPFPYNALRFGPYGWVHPGRWEVGSYLLPWLTNSSEALLVFSETTDPGRGSIIITSAPEDEQLRVVYDRAESIQRTPQLTFVYLHGEIARQLYNGFRVGAGFTLIGSPASKPFTAGEVNARLGPNEYTFLYDETVTNAFVSGHLSYTFRRFRRLRPAIGINAATQVINQRETTTRIIEGGTGRIIEQSTFDQFDLLIDRLFFLAQISLQYQLSPHFSLGLEAAQPLGSNYSASIPIVSIGGRYNFYQR